MEAQLGLLEVGITPRACQVYEPWLRTRVITGALAALRPLAPKPS
jgi:hypothetical protein